MAIVCATALVAYAQPAGTGRWDRYLDIGTAFYFEGQADSAKVYLEPVFENDANQKTTAARYLLDIALNEGDTPKINEYALFLADNYDLSITHERQKSHRQILLIGGVALLVLLVMGGVFLINHKRHKKAEANLLEQQQYQREVYDRKLDAAQTAIEKQTFENLQKQAKEILSRGNQRKRILEAFNSTYPHVYERLKSTYPDLTEQEYDLLVLNFLEFRIKEEAEILELSQNTVMKYRSNLLKKVGKDPVIELLG
ncbi:MAG: hypothetical protein IKT08_06540 [Bacteroidales bacterium]|nr:hypothetical protein [Bacteroidales bacterium]